MDGGQRRPLGGGDSLTEAEEAGTGEGRTRVQTGFGFIQYSEQVNGAKPLDWEGAWSAHGTARMPNFILNELGSQRKVFSR